MLEKVVLYLLGALSAGVGWLIVRYLRKDHVTEDLARRKSAADLIAHLRDIGVPMEQVDGLLAALGRRRGDKVELLSKQELTVEEFTEAKEFAAIEAAQTQSEMNMRQGERARRLDHRMQAAFEKLRHQLDDGMHDDMRGALDEAQSAWLLFRDKECAFAGAPFEDGTMRPFIVSAAFSYVTKIRAEMLENELKPIEFDAPVHQWGKR